MSSVASISLSHLPSITQPYVLDALPRPPTPPRESEHHDLEPSHNIHRLPRRLSAQSQKPARPLQVLESTQNHANKLCKRVEWSDTTDYEETPRKLHKSKSTPVKSLRPLPPSSDRPSRSILKKRHATDCMNQPSSPIISSKSETPRSIFVNMLESVCKQLAGDDSSSRIDGYLTLNGVLKASEHIPDTEALRLKLDIISQSILRDATNKTTGNTINTALAINALTLLASLLYRPKIAACLKPDFCSRIIDFAISAFEASIASKDIVKHLMWIVGHQNFSRKVMTSDRLGRLLASLQDIESHTKGRSIVLGRMVVYAKVLQQHRQVMIDHLSWIEHLLRDMLSSLKDVRSAAITWGLEAANRLGTERYVSWAVSSMLDRSDPEVDDGRAYFNLYSTHLSTMVAQKKDAVVVPQIWSVIVLFFRSRPEQLERWKHMRAWLCNIQECFNCGDFAVKKQANIAWSRFILAVCPGEATSSNMVKMLCQPLHGQLRRKIPTQHAADARQSTIATVCSLLYYTLVPSASHKLLDKFWDAYVVELVNNCLLRRTSDDLSAERTNVSYACSILEALFNDNRQISWSQDRALETRPIQIQEIPALESKWLRNNAGRVFATLKPLFETCLLDFAEPNSRISLVWHAFLASVRSAGEKEVKVSDELMIVMSCFFTNLSQLWQQGPNGHSVNGSCSVKFVAAIAAIVDDVIQSLGHLPFTEKLLRMTESETFTVVATPSRKPPKLSGHIRSPLQHLISLLAQPSPGLVYSSELSEQLDRVVRPFLMSRRSKSSQLDLTLTLCHLLLPFPNSASAIALWDSIVSYTTKSLTPASSSNTDELDFSEQPLGIEYRDLCKILHAGFQISYGAAQASWVELYDAAATKVLDAAGEAGLALALIDPLAKAIYDQVERGAISSYDPLYVLPLLQKAAYPRDRQALDIARRRLWGTSTTNQRSSMFDPLSNLHRLTSDALHHFYSSLSVDTFDICTIAIDCVDKFMQRCPKEYLLDALTIIQTGVAPWIRDSGLKLRSQTVASLFTKVADLIVTITSLIGNFPLADSTILHKLALLICAGCESKHRSIASTTVQMWNATFGLQKRLQYPDEVASALRRLRLVADLSLPEFPENPSDLHVLPPSFREEDSQFNMDRASIHEPISHNAEKSLEDETHTAPNTSSLAPAHLPRKRRNDTSDGAPSRKRSAKKAVNAKLRHNDSQIQFEPVTSTPFGEDDDVSQILTERQREVKERQRREAALLSDGIPSPRIATPRSKQPRNSLFDQSTVSMESGMRITTPTIDRHSSPFAGDVESSPTSHKTTPHRSIPHKTTPHKTTPKRAQLHHDSELTSSPPQRPKQDENAQITLIPWSPLDFEGLQDGWNNVSSPPSSVIMEPVVARQQPYTPMVTSPLKKSSTVRTSQDDRQQEPNVRTSISPHRRSSDGDVDDATHKSSSPLHDIDAQGTKHEIVDHDRRIPAIDTSDTNVVVVSELDHNKISEETAAIVDPPSQDASLQRDKRPEQIASPQRKRRSDVQKITSPPLHIHTSAVVMKKTPVSRVLQASKVTRHDSARDRKSLLQIQSTIPETPIHGGNMDDMESAHNDIIPAQPVDHDTPVPAKTSKINDSVILETVVKPRETRIVPKASNISSSPNTTSHRLHSDDTTPSTTSTIRRQRNRKRKRSIAPDSEIADSQEKDAKVVSTNAIGDPVVEDIISPSRKRLRTYKSKKAREPIPLSEEQMLQSIIRSQQDDDADEDIQVEDTRMVDEEEPSAAQSVSRVPSSMQKIFDRVEIVTPSHLSMSSNKSTNSVDEGTTKPFRASSKNVLSSPAAQLAESSSQSRHVPTPPSPPRANGIISLLSTAIASLKRTVLTKRQASQVDGLMYELRGEIWDAEKRGRMNGDEGGEGSQG